MTVDRLTRNGQPPYRDVAKAIQFAQMRLSKELKEHGVEYTSQDFIGRNAKSTLLDPAIEAFENNQKRRTPEERNNLFTLILACFNLRLQESVASPSAHTRYTDFIKAHAKAHAVDIQLWAYPPLTDVLDRIVPMVRRPKG